MIKSITFLDSPPVGGQEAVNLRMWFVYALYNSVKHKIYIGQSGNLDQRVIEHNKKRGNHFTGRLDGKWILIYKEGVIDRKSALMREKELKNYQGRQFIKKFIPR